MPRTGRALPCRSRQGAAGIGPDPFPHIHIMGRRDKKSPFRVTFTRLSDSALTYLRGAETDHDFARRGAFGTWPGRAPVGRVPCRDSSAPRRLRMRASICLRRKSRCRDSCDQRGQPSFSWHPDHPFTAHERHRADLHGHSRAAGRNKDAGRLCGRGGAEHFDPALRRSRSWQPDHSGRS